MVWGSKAMMITVVLVATVQYTTTTVALLRSSTVCSTVCILVLIFCTPTAGVLKEERCICPLAWAAEIMGGLNHCRSTKAVLVLSPFRFRRINTVEIVVFLARAARLLKKPRRLLLPPVFLILNSEAARRK